MKKLFIISVAVFIMTGCQNDDEESSDLTIDEARSLIESSASSLVGDVISLVESNSVKELINLSTLINEHDLIAGRTSQQSWTKKSLDNLITRFVDGPSTRMGINNPATFDEIKGLYTWNFDLEKFEATESEFFVVRFPTNGSDVNDAEFKISDLEFVTINDTENSSISEDYHIPSMIIGYLKIDNINVVDLSYQVKWTVGGSPVEADIVLLVDSFNFSIDFQRYFLKIYKFTYFYFSR